MSARSVAKRTLISVCVRYWGGGGGVERELNKGEKGVGQLPWGGYGWGGGGGGLT